MTSLKLILTLLVLTSTFFVSESFAQEITIDTNKESFSAGDTVDISGIVENGEGELLALEIKSPSGETILIRTITVGAGGSYDLKFKIPSSGESGTYEIVANAEVGGNEVTESKTISMSSGSSSTEASADNGGGCLIATATFGSELAPQVQQLRELRDNTLLQTESGSNFMAGFNSFYYSFSPAIADLERENPAFKEAVKLTITPLLASLSLLNHVDIDTESEMLGYGISLILLNVGMYFFAPGIVIYRLIRTKT